METDSNLPNFIQESIKLLFKVIEHLLLLLQSQKESFQKISSYGLERQLTRQDSNMAFLLKSRAIESSHCLSSGYIIQIQNLKLMSIYIKEWRLKNRNNSILSPPVTSYPSFRNSPVLLGETGRTLPWRILGQFQSHFEKDKKSLLRVNFYHLLQFQKLNKVEQFTMNSEFKNRFVFF